MSGTQRVSYNAKRKGNQQPPSHADYGHQQATSVPNGNPAPATLGWAAPAVDNQYPVDRPPSNMSSGAAMAGMYTAQMRIPSGPNQVRPQQVMGNSPSMTFPPNGAHVVFQQTPGQVPLYTIYQTPSGPHQQMQQGQSVRYQVPFYQQQQPMYSQPTFMPAGLPPAGYYPGNYSYNQQQPGPAQQQQYVAQQQQQPFAASFPPPANPIYASAPPMSTNTSQHQNAMGTHTGPVVAQPGMGGAPQQQPNYNTTMYNSVQTQPPPPDPQHGNQGGQGVQLQGPGAARPRAKNVLAIVDPNTLEVQNKEAVEEAQKSTVEPETASGRTSAESFAQAPSTNAATAGADSAHESRASDQSTVDGRPGIAQEFMRNVAQVAFEPDAAVPAAAQPAASAVSPVASAAAAVDQPPHSPAVIMDEERNDTIDSVEFAYDSPDARSNDKQGAQVSKESSPSTTQSKDARRKTSSTTETDTSRATSEQPSSTTAASTPQQPQVSHSPKPAVSSTPPSAQHTPSRQLLDVSSTDRNDISLEEGEIREEEEATSVRSGSIPPTGDDEEEEDVVESLEAKKAAKYGEWEERMRQFLDNKEEVNVEARSYGREFLGLCGEIVQESGEPKCPLGDDALKGFGLDRSSMPSQQQAYGGGQRRFDNQQARGSFALPWMGPVNTMPRPTSGPRTPYAGRMSDSHRRERGKNQKLPPIPRPSIERTATANVKLNQAEKPWKPERKLEAVVADPSDTEAKQLYKDVRGVLNKITPSNFAELCGDFLKLEVHMKKENMSTVIDIIFDKAVEEPKFCPLYSDLCKEQVKLEMKTTGSKSDFRSGILTKCQQTFETKREEALQQLRKDAEAETDEKKKVQLLAEWEDAERKERRRMFGNIGFIGQLYRNELLVPLILQWCVVHLFQRHANTPGGDEESVECAVRMLETIGKIFDRDSAKDKEMAQKTLLYYQHLQEISKQVSNRIRFSIENLIEMRNNGWVPRKSADQGPKTLKEVHLDAKKEELANKIQRDQYDRQMSQNRGGPGDNFGGQGARNQRRPPMTGRPSQDGRQGGPVPYSGRGSQQGMQEKRAQAAAAANNTAQVAAKKDVSLKSSMETGGALGSARRNKWTTGAGGGGGHQDAATHALSDPKSTSRSSTGVRTNRGGLGSHESSQPSSRDVSESRKSSIADSVSERQQALKLTSQIVSGRPLLDASHSPVPGSSHPAALADSNGTPSPSVTPGPADADDVDIDIDEDRIQRGILHDVKEYCTDAVKIQEVFDEMMERCAQAPPSTVFRLLMKAAVEETLNAHDRRYIGQIICRCLQADHIRAEALKGIADYARCAIDAELWVDVPKVWEYMAEVLLWATLCDMKHFDGLRPSLDDFAETFQTAQQDTRKPHVLLTLVLKRMFESLDEKGAAQMAFAEMKAVSPDTPDLIEALKATTVDGSDLYTLLTQ